jgi:hypothetical protein
MLLPWHTIRADNVESDRENTFSPETLKSEGHLLFNDTNYSTVHSRRLKPSCALCGSPPSLGGGLFIQGEHENPFIVGYHESIRHRFTPLCSCGGL